MLVDEITLTAKRGKDDYYPIGLTCNGCGKWTPEFSIDLHTGKAYCPTCMAEGNVDNDEGLSLQGTYKIELNPLWFTGPM